MAAKKEYYITDLQGNFYRAGTGNQLLLVPNCYGAGLFTKEQVEKRIGTGMKAKMYRPILREDYLGAKKQLVSEAEELVEDVEEVCTVTEE